MNDWQIKDAPYQHWIKNVETPWRKKLASRHATINMEESWPLISIVIPTYNTPLEFLTQALDSILHQSYDRWELCIADDASTEPGIFELIQGYVDRDSRVQAVRRESNGGIAAATNTAFSLANGQYIAFMDHDDTLPEHAIFLVAQELRSSPGTLVLYSDSDNINTSSERSNPYFKPDWNYELLLGQNYLNHLSVYSHRLVTALGGVREGFEGSQDYDLALRATEHLEQNQIKHLPHILYHWRVLPSSVSQSNLKQAIQAARSAIAEHLDRCGHSATISSAVNAKIYNRVTWNAPKPLKRMLLLVHGEDEDMVDNSLSALKEATDYDQLVIRGLVTDNTSSTSPLGALINAQIEEYPEDLLCILPAGFCPDGTNWAQHLAGSLSRDMVGAVGAKLVSVTGKIMAGPLVIEPGHSLDENPLKQSMGGASETDKGYFAHLALDHQVSALHGACMVTRYETYTRAGGLNPSLSSLALLGADFSFRVHNIGLVTIWSAGTGMRCLDNTAESTLLAQPLAEEIKLFNRTWASRLEVDSLYNPNFSRGGISHRLRE